MVGCSPLISEHVQKIDLKQTTSEYKTQTGDFQLQVKNKIKGAGAREYASTEAQWKF